MKREDLTNQKFNILTLLEYRYSKGGKAFWLCKCDCGNEKIIAASEVKYGGTKSCGCLNHKIDDLTGQRFLKLLVKSLNCIKNRGALWNCLCDCGTWCIVTAKSLKAGDTKSCGCHNRFVISQKVGKNHPRWRHDLSEEDRKENSDRHYSPENHAWRKKVFNRDNYTCQCCKDNKGGNLEAHHIYSWGTHKSLRYTTSNGITLCKTCHVMFHKEYGYGKNTQKQLTQFLKASHDQNPNPNQNYQGNPRI